MCLCRIVNESKLIVYPRLVYLTRGTILWSSTRHGVLSLIRLLFSYTISLFLSLFFSLSGPRIVRKPFHPSINVTEAVCVIRPLYDVFGLSTWLRLENQLREKYGLRLVCAAFIFFDLCSRLSELHVHGFAALGSALWYHYTPMDFFFFAPNPCDIYHEFPLPIVCNEFFITIKYRGPPPFSIEKTRCDNVFYRSQSIRHWLTSVCSLRIGRFQDACNGLKLIRMLLCSHISLEPH